MLYVLLKHQISIPPQSKALLWKHAKWLRLQGSISLVHFTTKVSRNCSRCQPTVIIEEERMSNQIKCSNWDKNASFVAFRVSFPDIKLTRLAITSRVLWNLAGRPAHSFMLHYTIDFNTNWKLPIRYFSAQSTP